MTSVFDTPPDAVNEIGTKWWRDKETTEYAQRPDHKGRALPHIQAFYVEDPTGRRSRVLVDQTKGAIIYESQQLEAVAVYIDVLKVD